MKIEDILLENDTLKEVDGLKPEERLGARIASWFNKNRKLTRPSGRFRGRGLTSIDAGAKLSTGQLANKVYDPSAKLSTGQLANKVYDPDAGAKLSTGQLANKVYDPSAKLSTGQLANKVYDPDASTSVAKKDVSIDRGDPALWDAGTPAVAKTDQEAYADPSVLRDLEKTDQEAYADPSVVDDMKPIDRIKANAGMKDSDYKTPQGAKRTARDMALDKSFPYTAPDGRRLKYPHGDLRNLFEPSPDTREAGSDVVVRDGKRKKSWKNPNTNRSDDDRK